MYLHIFQYLDPIGISVYHRYFLVLSTCFTVFGIKYQKTETQLQLNLNLNLSICILHRLYDNYLLFIVENFICIHFLRQMERFINKRETPVTLDKLEKCS